MKKLCILVLVLTLIQFVTGCGKRDVSIIGGADGPTKIIVAKTDR